MLIMKSFIFAASCKRLNTPVPLPVYLDINVSVAVGLTSGTQADFQKHMRDLTPLAERVDIGQMDTNEGIHWDLHSIADHAYDDAHVPHIISFFNLFELVDYSMLVSDLDLG